MSEESEIQSRRLRLAAMPNDPPSNISKLSFDFHKRLKESITTCLPCEQCVEPLCSCSGRHFAYGIFLPGEREWIEQQIGIAFQGISEHHFPFQGDCNYLIGQQCAGGRSRVWDCLSFPLQPVLVNGELVPYFAKNCTMHPADMNPFWIYERWRGWKTIEQHVDKRWLEWYCSIPPFEEQ